MSDSGEILHREFAVAGTRFDLHVWLGEMRAPGPVPGFEWRRKESPGAYCVQLVPGEVLRLDFSLPGFQPGRWAEAACIGFSLLIGTPHDQLATRIAALVDCLWHQADDCRIWLDQARTLGQISRNWQEVIDESWLLKSFPTDATTQNRGLEIILQEVSKAWDVNAGLLLSRRREYWIIEPRMAFYLVARRCSNLSLSTIGAFLGKRNHGTIVHGCQQAANLLATVPQFRARVAAICARFGQPITA